MHRSGPEANRTQLKPSIPKREITNITNSQYTKRTYGQQSEQLFPKRWPLSNRNRTKNNTSTQLLQLQKIYCTAKRKDKNEKKIKKHKTTSSKNKQTNCKLRKGLTGFEHIKALRFLICWLFEYSCQVCVAQVT